MPTQGAQDEFAGVGNDPGVVAPASVVAPTTREGETGRDAELVRRLRAGEDAAYEELVRGLTGRLLAVARRVARSEADAEDAVQEAFLSAFRSIHSFDGRSTLSTWLHRIVVNAALMKARKASSSRESSIENLLPRFEGGLHTVHPTAWKPISETAEERREQQGAVLAALDELPEEFRAVLVLKDVEGLQSAEIAASLGISDALVRQRLHRGRLALMKLLAPAMTEGRS